VRLIGWGELFIQPQRFDEVLTKLHASILSQHQKAHTLGNRALFLNLKLLILQGLAQSFLQLPQRFGGVQIHHQQAVGHTRCFQTRDFGLKGSVLKPIEVGT
jgi:hypothetical protein